MEHDHDHKYLMFSKFSNKSNSPHKTPMALMRDDDFF